MASPNPIPTTAPDLAKRPIAEQHSPSTTGPIARPQHGVAEPESQPCAIPAKKPFRYHEGKARFYLSHYGFILKKSRARNKSRIDYGRYQILKQDGTPVTHPFGSGRALQWWEVCHIVDDGMTGFFLYQRALVNLKT